MNAPLPDRLPPQNIEAERGVLGSMLLDPAAIDEVMFALDPGHFYRAAHGLLCRAIYEMRSEGEAVDSITLEERLRADGDLDQVGGVEYLYDLLASVPHAANAGYYAQIVREKAVARDLIEAAHQILRDGYSNAFSAEDLLGRAERAIFAIGEAQSSGGRTTTLAVATAGALAGLDRLRVTGVVGGVRLGWHDLDADLGGLLPGQLVVVAARPSMGKSAFCLQAAIAVASQGLESVFLSLEMSGHELALRALSCTAGVDSRLFRQPRLVTDRLIEGLGRAQAGLAEIATVHLDDTASLTPTQIASIARRLSARRRIGAVFVDYLQIVTPDSGVSRQEQVASIARRLKTLARELGAPVIAMSQLNREVERRESKRPTMADLRESGEIENAADAVLLLHRPEYYDPNDQPGLAEVIVAKNRNGATGVVKLQFDRAYTRFSDLSPVGAEVY